jgi:GTP-binding protein
LRSAGEALGALATEHADIGVTLFSALKKTGVGDVAVTLRQWVRPLARADVTVDAGPGA